MSGRTEYYPTSVREEIGGRDGTGQGVRRGVKGLVRSGERVLLIKERHSDGSPFWTLPGGGAESGESSAEALARELREELGCRAVIGDQVGECAYAHHSAGLSVSVYTIFECMLCSRPAPNRTEGIDDLRWIRPGECPPRTIPQVRYLLSPDTQFDST